MTNVKRTVRMCTVDPRDGKVIGLAESHPAVDFTSDKVDLFFLTTSGNKQVHVQMTHEDAKALAEQLLFATRRRAVSNVRVPSSIADAVRAVLRDAFLPDAAFIANLCTCACLLAGFTSTELINALTRGMESEFTHTL